jgi:2-phospho-L-lactate guanylyltransferase
MREHAIWGVLPIKRTDQAKQRLGSMLEPRQRQALMLAMMHDVLTALTAARGLEGIAVVTEDPIVTRIAQSYGCRMITQSAAEGHTAAVSAAGRLLAREGRSGMLTIPGDVPLVTAAEIEAVLAAHGPVAGFTIVPAHDEQGSNAILMTPADLVPLRFGENSFYPHLAAAEAKGITPHVVKLPGLGCDLDTPEDLARFMTIPNTTRTLALLKDALEPTKP